MSVVTRVVEKCACGSKALGLLLRAGFRALRENRRASNRKVPLSDLFSQLIDMLWLIELRQFRRAHA